MEEDFGGRREMDGRGREMVREGRKEEDGYHTCIKGN